MINCAHAHRGTLTVTPFQGHAFPNITGRSSLNIDLGAMQLEFCEVCGSVLIQEAVLAYLVEERKKA